MGGWRALSAPRVGLRGRRARAERRSLLDGLCTSPTEGVIIRSSGAFSMLPVLPRQSNTHANSPSGASSNGGLGRSAVDRKTGNPEFRQGARGVVAELSGGAV